MQIMFETFNVPALAMVPSPVLCTRAHQIECGCVVSIDAYSSWAACVWDGKFVVGSVKVMSHGEIDLFKLFLHLLEQKGHDFTSNFEMEIVNRFLGSHLFFGHHNIDDDTRCIPFEFSEGLTIDIPTKDLRMCGNGLFDPELLHWRSPNDRGLCGCCGESTRRGIVSLIHQSIACCGEDRKSTLFENVVIDGKIVSVEGFAQRLQFDLCESLSIGITKRAWNLALEDVSRGNLLAVIPEEIISLIAAFAEFTPRVLDLKMDRVRTCLTTRNPPSEQTTKRKEETERKEQNSSERSKGPKEEKAQQFQHYRWKTWLGGSLMACWIDDQTRRGWDLITDKQEYDESCDSALHLRYDSLCDSSSSITTRL